jgi:hypothetical protein
MLTPPDKEHLEQIVTSARGHVSNLLCDNFSQQQLETHMQISHGDVSSDHDDTVSEHTNDDVSTDWGDDACYDRVLNRVNIESSHRDCFAGTITPMYTSCKVFRTILACMT